MSDDERLRSSRKLVTLIDLIDFTQACTHVHTLLHVIVDA